MTPKLNRSKPLPPQNLEQETAENTEKKCLCYLCGPLLNLRSDGLAAKKRRRRKTQKELFCVSCAFSRLNLRAVS